MTEEKWSPKDGGFKAWFTVVGRFFVAGFPMGIVLSFGVIYVELLKILEQQNVEHAASKASLVGSLAYGVIYFISIAGGVLCDRLGIRLTAIVGTAVGSLGLLASSWLTDKIEILPLTYSVMFGGGTGIVVTSTIGMLSFHFDKRLGLVNGLTCSGSPVFAVIVPIIIGVLLPRIGLPGVFRVFALIVFVLLLPAAVAFKIPEKALDMMKEKQQGKTALSNVINMDNWRNLRFVIWCVAVAITSFGYFVPFVHIVNYVQVQFPGTNGSPFIVYLSLGSACSRFIIGIMSDHPNVNPIFLQQVLFISIGVLIMLLSVATTWWSVITIVVGIGLLEGGFLTLFGKIATQLCGLEGVSQAVGFVAGLCGVPLAAGAPVAGYLFQTTGSYYVPFLVSGCTPVFGGLLMTAIHFVKTKEVAEKKTIEISTICTRL